MPIYEYKCRECGTDFEEIVSVNAVENPPCPSCHSNETEKKMSVFCGAGSSGNSGTSGGSSGFS